MQQQSADRLSPTEFLPPAQAPMEVSQTHGDADERHSTAQTCTAQTGTAQTGTAQTGTMKSSARPPKRKADDEVPRASFKMGTAEATMLRGAGAGVGAA